MEAVAAGANLAAVAEGGTQGLAVSEARATAEAAGVAREGEGRGNLGGNPDRGRSAAMRKAIGIMCAAIFMLASGVLGAMLTWGLVLLIWDAIKLLLGNW